MAWTEPCVVIDRTHLGRRASGMERITRDLFSPESLRPLNVQGSRLGAGRLTTMLRQLVLNPLDALRHPRTVWIFSGFPPSPAFGRLAHRSVLYVHDLFLIEREADLNRAGRYYMAPSFRAALRQFQWFFANSATTAERLRRHIGPSASVLLYRPPARDTLGLADLRGPRPDAGAGPLKIGMIGTVEPRKNYGAALAIRAALAARIGRPVELHVIGRTGWGPDAVLLAQEPDVHRHGFVEDSAIPGLVADWDLFLSTSHDEGLGLPLLEVQHAGLPIVAPDIPVFREVLGESATLVNPAAPAEAAERIDAILRGPDARDRAREAGRLNIARWNRLAADDHAAVLVLLSALLATLDKA
jgi:glycosyltransferase involved in cell wall biosynthesis